MSSSVSFIIDLSSSSSSELQFTIPSLPVDSSVGLWFRMTVMPSDTYNADDFFTLYFNPDQAGEEGIVDQEVRIHHSRLKHSVSVFDGIYIRSQTNFVRVFFDHLVDSNWFTGLEGAIYSAYVNGKHVVDFNHNAHDIFVNKIDEIYSIEVFAIPHFGFKVDTTVCDDAFPLPLPFCLGSGSPSTGGKSAKITFRTLRPDVFDINNIQLFTDNQTGTVTDTIIASINPINGTGSGSLYLNSSRLQGAV